MRIGDSAMALVNGGIWTSCEVIDFIGCYIVVSGMEELRRAAEEAREPVGISLPAEMVKEK